MKLIIHDVDLSLTFSVENRVLEAARRRPFVSEVPPPVSNVTDSRTQGFQIGTVHMKYQEVTSKVSDEIIIDVDSLACQGNISRPSETSKLESHSRGMNSLTIEVPLDSLSLT